MGFNQQIGTGAQAASQSLAWGAQGVQATALGDLALGVGGFSRNLYQSQVAANNAKIAQANAGADLSAGAYEAAQTKLRYGLLEGQQKAAQGANGIDVNVGSAPAVRQSTERVSAMDAALTMYSAQRAAYGQQVEASSQAAQSRLDKLGAFGSLTQGLYSAGSSIIGGATSLATRRAQFGLEFPDTAGPAPNFSPG